MVRVQADFFQQLVHLLRFLAAFCQAVGLDSFRDDFAYSQARIERRLRVLKNELHLAIDLALLPAACRSQIGSRKADRAARRRVQADYGPAERRLAAAALADQPERLPFADPAA